ncbi:MAG TPA: 4Fe-4S binding protein [Terriglobales bacterium]|nr:4Fe-4S binding protein [Terriglobales bacterium]
MATQLHTELISEIPPSLIAPKQKPVSNKPKKKLVRRTDRDISQLLRRSYQALFLLMNIWLGGIFYLWVRQFETRNVTGTWARPAGVEGWLPIAGMMNTKYWVLTRHIPALHPAAMFLLLTFVAISFLFRKAFCSWLCPVGTISEYLWRAGRKLFRRNFRMWRWLDIPLRGLKYLLLGFFVWAVSSMSANAVAEFMRSDYGLIADVKMLNFFRFMGEAGAIVIAVLVVASIFIQNFWCRYLCPYGALLGLTALFSPLRIRREPEACIDCAKCAKACPSLLPVDKLITVKSAECTACMQCVAVCPAKGALQMSPVWTRAAGAHASNGKDLLDGRSGRPYTTWAMAAGIAVLFSGIIGFAKTAGYWNSDVPAAVYRQLVPRANEATHPMPGYPALN